MWDTAETTRNTLTHDMPCSACGHAMHTYLPCSDQCLCLPNRISGAESDLRGSDKSGVYLLVSAAA